MKHRIQFNQRALLTALILATLTLGVWLAPFPRSASASLKQGGALLVQVEAAQGFAFPGGVAPANFLIVVTDAETGAPVSNLVQADFMIINHFLLPGQVCGFSNNIASFVNAGTGAYQIQVGLPGCAWVRGDYLAQVLVNAAAGKGQAAATLSIECREVC